MKIYQGICLALVALTSADELKAEMGVTQAPGMGPYFRGGQHLSELTDRLISGRRYVSHLSHRLVIGPVTVQGKGAITVVANNMLLNVGRATNSLVEVKCPRLGHRVLIRGNMIQNHGEIRNFRYGSATTAVTTVNCSNRAASKIEFNNNQTNNYGQIKAK